jgi:hypothetical protein
VLTRFQERPRCGVSHATTWRSRSPTQRGWRAPSSAAPACVPPTHPAATAVPRPLKTEVDLTSVRQGPTPVPLRGTTPPTEGTPDKFCSGPLLGRGARSAGWVPCCASICARGVQNPCQNGCCPPDTRRSRGSKATSTPSSTRACQFQLDGGFWHRVCSSRVARLESGWGRHGCRERFTPCLVSWDVGPTIAGPRKLRR